MEQLHKKPILLLITNSFAAINVIHSGLIKEMDRQYEVHVLSSLLGKAEIALINKHFHIHARLIDLPFSAESRLIMLIRKIQKAIFFHYFGIETYKIKSLGENRILNFVTYATLLIMNSLNLNKFFLILARKLIVHLSARSQNLKGLHSFHFRGVISSSPLDIVENRIVNFLGRDKIPSVGMIISWDNLTSKGIINANHTCILAWNKFMADEYRKFYSIFGTHESEVCITGIPRFDTYFKKPPAAHAKTNFRRKYSIKPGDKIILFATSSCKLFPRQIAVTKDLIAYTREHKNTVLIVRCHPADNFHLYDPFSDEDNLRIWFPDNHFASPVLKSTARMPDLNFLDSLTEMIRHCDVCINAASTMRLDAAACNKHIISIAYDGKHELPYSESVRRLYDYSHQIPLNRLKIDHIVTNKEELFSALDTVLTENSECNNLSKIRPFIFHKEPKSVHAAMSAIKKCLG
ncbi:CDP-glycerol glycerophosphotransferase family protein [Dyadobacter flavalbus]|nr:CDP-glycerol glycerophosphotransferase family protein [Dyadobacter flavalbus]